MSHPADKVIASFQHVRERIKYLKPLLHYGSSCKAIEKPNSWKDWFPYDLETKDEGCVWPHGLFPGCWRFMLCRLSCFTTGRTHENDIQGHSRQGSFWPLLAYVRDSLRTFLLGLPSSPNGWRCSARCLWRVSRCEWKCDAASRHMRWLPRARWNRRCTDPETVRCLPQGMHRMPSSVRGRPHRMFSMPYHAVI